MNRRLQKKLAKAIKKPPRTDSLTGKKILYFSNSMFYWGIVCIIMAVFITWMAVVKVPPQDTTENVLILILFAFIGLAGIVSIIGKIMTKVYVSEDGIEIKAPWPGLSNKVQWKDIVYISYSMGMFVFLLDNGVKIGVPVNLYGIKYLICCFEKYLELNVYYNIIEIVKFVLSDRLENSG